MWDKFKSKSYQVIGVICFIIFFSSSFAWAELEAGAVINAANIDQMKPQKFEGKTIASMLPKQIEWWIRNYNLKITLTHSKPTHINLDFIEATKRYHKDVKIDPETLEISGYKAGMPFPYIADDDPFKARKLIYNAYLKSGYQYPCSLYIPHFGYNMIDFKTGIERKMVWQYWREFYTGRIAGSDGSMDNPLLDDKVLYKQVSVCKEPYDLRGVGTFFIRYNSGKMDDTWVYLRASRRTRRLSGGGWFDSDGGTDHLRDEYNNFSANPTWIPKFNYLGKRYVLAVAHSRTAHLPPEQCWPVVPNFPGMDHSSPPYCNPLDDWEPREVYVIEQILPEEHTYLRRVYFIDTKSFMWYYGDVYNKKNEFEKIVFLSCSDKRGSDKEDSWFLAGKQGFLINFKLQHGTVWRMPADDYYGNAPQVKPNKLTLSTMEAISKGRYKRPEGIILPKNEGKKHFYKDLNLDWTAIKLK